MAAAIFLPRLLGGGQPALGTGAAAGSTEDQVGPVQCVSELEQILCGASDDVQDYWIADYPTAFGGQYTETDTTFFSGSVNTGCGQATAQVGPFYCPADGFVYFDLDFLTQLQDQFGAEGDLAAQYIVAHEYGHHVQNLLGISDDVNRRSQQDPGRANQYSVALELQADCFAGAWARNADERSLLEEGDLQEALGAAAAVGDDRIQQQTQGRVSPESWTHGSAEQRVSWFRRGFDTGDPARCTTFQEVL